MACCIGSFGINFHHPRSRSALPVQHTSETGCGTGLMEVGMICSKIGCKKKAVKHLNKNTYYCAKHYRFVTIKMGCAQRGSYNPSYEELEKLLSDLDGFKCPVCGRKMGWFRSSSGGRTISIQHDHSGRIRLMCIWCNGRHRGIGDVIYSLQKDESFCCRCRAIKRKSEFSIIERHGRKVPYSYCKECQRKTWKETYNRRKGR